MDPDYFYSEFGPTTVERHDPLFLLSKGCCWWSGQSWPFATTQTLKGLANLLQGYEQDHVTRADYFKLLRNYALSQRKDGKPYVAEALHPDTGSWRGHDMYYRSEHYFHSGFVDLIITGLAGLIVEDGDSVTVDPLIPAEWEFFALDQIPYRGHRVAIVWDKTGKRYGRGAGLQVLVDGQKLAASPKLQSLTFEMPSAKEVPLDPRDEVNFAVNNDGSYFPRFSASHTGPKSYLAFVHDGNTAWYHLHPPLRWTSEGSTNASDWVAVDLGMSRPITHVKLYLLNDGDGQAIAAPDAIALEYSDGDAGWKRVPDQKASPRQPAGRQPYTISFPELKARRLRAIFKHADGRRSGITEFEAWGPVVGPYTPAPPPAGNIAYSPNPKKGFPKASASFHDRYGGIPASAHDGKIVYRATPTNRWTSYGSPNKESDWFALDFGETKKVARVLLHIYDDRGGVQAPKYYNVQSWTGEGWKDIPDQSKVPEKPAGGAVNTVTFASIETSKIRVVFTHIGKGNTRSGLTEIEVWNE